MGAHAKLGASGAYRWMNCPGSIRAVDELPANMRRGSNFYADEGTAAHAVAARCLVEGLPADDFMGWHVLMPSEEVVETVEEDEFGQEPYHFTVDDEMAEAVQIYLDHCAAIEANAGDPQVGVEVQVKLRDDMWGTADHVVLDRLLGLLTVSDYKHGKGVVVEVEANEQAMYYALGALEACEDPGEVATVRLCIIQPRASHEDGEVRTFEITARDLLEWKGTLMAAADRTYEPDAPRVPGPWCRFCDAAATCDEQRAAVKAQIKADWDAAPLPEIPGMQAVLPDFANPEAIAKALAAVPMIDKWCRAVESKAQDLLERGEHVPGYKLVRKRANRRWRDEDEVAEAALAKPEVREEDVFERKLKSPAKLEKVRKIGKEWVAQYAEKPEGGLTLAADGDQRTKVVVPKIEWAEPPALPEGAKAESDELDAWLADVEG